jgi:hypothetical protein
VSWGPGVFVDALREGDTIQWQGDPARILEVDSVEFDLIAMTLLTIDGIAAVTAEPSERLTLLKGA